MTYLSCHISIYFNNKEVAQDSHNLNIFWLLPKILIYLPACLNQKDNTIQKRKKPNTL